MNNQTPDTKPGNYYVSVVDGPRYAYKETNTMQRLTYSVPTDTFALRTLDDYGNEHIELFTVPATAISFYAAGVDCALLRRLYRSVSGLFCARSDEHSASDKPMAVRT